MGTGRRDVVLVGVPAEWVHPLVESGAGPGSACVGWGPVLQVGRAAEALLAVDLCGPAFRRFAELVVGERRAFDRPVSVLSAGSWWCEPTLDGLSGSEVADLIHDHLGVRE